MKHPVEHLRFPEATVEAATEFRRVPGQVFWADAMMDTTNIAFNIGDQGVDPGQDLRRLFTRTGDGATHGGRAEHPGSYILANRRF